MAEPIDLRDRRDKLKAGIPSTGTDRGSVAWPEEVAEPGFDVAPFPLGRLPIRTPLVGRTEELSYLKSQFDAIAAGDPGRLFLVSGEPGVGKTRLAQELGLSVQQRGGIFLEGRYLREGTAPYGPWLEALGAGLRGLEREDVAQAVGPYGAELAPIFPELIEQLGPFPAPPRLPAEDRRRRLYDGIARLVSHLAQRAPLVVLLDDLQWAPGLTLLVHVTRRLRECRALVVGTYREQEFREQPALVREWADLNRARLITQISLTPLGEPETGRLAAHYFGEEPAAQLQAPVYRMTRGNAFFVEEVLRSLAEQGTVRPTVRGWIVVDPSRIEVPESMKLAIEERVARLGPTGRDVLQQAAVLGQELGFAAWQAMTGLAEAELAAEVERAVAARLLVDRSRPGEERYAFIDDQVQEVLYRHIPAPRRRRYHRRAGGALEALYADRLEAHLEELARHFVEGNDPAKGAEYAYRAGLKNDQLFNWARSIPLYRTALELWEEVGGHLEQRAATCEKLGDAICKSSLDAPKAIEYFQQALTLYEQVGNQRKIATLHSLIGREHCVSVNLAIVDVEKALEHLHLARSILEEAEESNALGWVYIALAQADWLLLQVSESIAWARKALAIGERLKSPALVANARCYLGGGLLIVGQIAEGRQILERGWRLAVEKNLAIQTENIRSMAIRTSALVKKPRDALDWAARRPDYRTVNSVAYTPLQLIVVYTLLGDFREAATIFEDCQSLLEDLGQPGFGRFSAAPGQLFLMSGDWRQAERLLKAGLEWAKAGHNYLSATRAAEQLGELSFESGDYARAEEYFVWAWDFYRKGADVLGELGLLPRLCRLYVRTDRVDEAQAYLVEAQAILARPEDWGGLPGEVYLAEALVRMAQGRSEEAESAFQRAVEVDRTYGLPWDEAKVCYEWAGAILRQADQRTAKWRQERGRELLTRALALWESLGARPWIAQAQFTKANLLLAGGQVGNREQALDLLDQALATARELGLTRLAEQVLARRAAVGDVGRSTPAQGRSKAVDGERGTETYPDGLTPREVDVLRLIAAGRTNKEIAADLIVSLPTVGRHISNIYGKIGARGRADATAYVLSRGLA